MSDVFRGQTLIKDTDINVADIRPILLALAEHMNVVIWRNEHVNGDTTFELFNTNNHKD